ncbi:MAG: transglycosylase SLT domain-containing protein [Bacteroidaceae bacterium]|nr:transglycosylase SLT domain-containing protein [Bacteroidaceae bacterium]
MNTRLKILLFSFVLTSPLFAQVNDEIIVEEDSGYTEVFDLPEGMAISEQELMNDYTNRNNLTEGNSSSYVRELSASDQVIVDRLSRIPTTIEMPLNNITRAFIDKYSNNMRSSVAVMLGSSNFYMPIFEEALERYGLPLELKYLPVIESALRPSATSRAGAAGLWQFMVTTGKRFGLEVNTLVDERRDPIKSSEAAAHYLSDLYNQFGDWGLAIAAYNCGENNVQKALLRAGGEDKDYWQVYNYLPRETRGYVPAFIAANYIMTYYCEHGITPLQASLPAASDTIVLMKELTFNQIASASGVTVDELRSLNPQYRRDIVPINYAVRMPMSGIESFVQNEDSIYAGNMVFNESPTRRLVTEDIEDASTQVEVQRSSYSSSYSRKSKSSSSRRSGKSKKSKRGNESVTVKKGDTLSSIARRSGLTVNQLKKKNGISGSTIKPGQKIKVK